MRDGLEWTRFASQLRGSGFATFQRELARFNRGRLQPCLPSPACRHDLESEARVLVAERDFIEAVREETAPLARDIPDDVDGFIAWFERLRKDGPGQGDPLFPWLETTATHEEIRWFVEQEVAGEAGFDDLLALTQTKMPEQAKLEMARNYWDEMGRGRSKGMHGPWSVSRVCSTCVIRSAGTGKCCDRSCGRTRAGHRRSAKGRCCGSGMAPGALPATVKNSVSLLQRTKPHRASFRV
jgi:hypothetical protein